MAKAAPPQPSQTAPRLRQLWKGPLVAGLCFGLAYGVTQRLLGFRVGELIQFGSGFDVQEFPGTSLESLKLRFGDAAAEIQGDLELQELERQQQQEAKRKEEQAKLEAAELQRSQQLDAEAAPPLESQLQPAPAPPAAPPLPPAVPTAQP